MRSPSNIITFLFVVVDPNVGGREGRVTPKIIYIDHFGNLITNLRDRKSGQIFIRGQMIRIVKNYLDVEKGELLAIVGSSGRVEISAREGSAQEFLGVERGEEIEYLD